MSLPLDLTKGVAINIRYEENDAISVWRDLKSEISEHLLSKFPLSEKVDLKANPNQVSATLTAHQVLDDSYHFSWESLIEHGRPESPIWVKWVHHVTRPIGKISTQV